MLTDPRLRAQLDQLWDKLWTGGLTNPMDAIEQVSYLLFLKRLDDEENHREQQARRRDEPFEPRLPPEMRWSHWSRLTAAAALKHVREVVFPWLKTMGGEGSSFERYMGNAEFKVNKPNLLIEACAAIDRMQIGNQNQDVQGDLYEYLLGRLTIAGRNGQFRTPRHIIRMMVCLIDPRPGERIGDLAAGTCGFPVNAYQYILERHTSLQILTYDEQGWPHNLVGEQLSPEQRAFLQQSAFSAFDNDSGMTMLRIGSMNLMLHGLEQPRFFYTDTLSKAYTEAGVYQVILMNPPFKGAVDRAEVSETLPENTRKSELLFLHLILRALAMGGRCAVIVPDGVLFGSSNAHVALRRKLVEGHRLDGVISMPSGVFKPYAGVSTAVLLFTKGGETERIWYYDMAHDGFSLDDKRQPVPESDLPDILDCYAHRYDGAFQAERQARLVSLREQTAPLAAERLRLLGEINRLTFERAIAPEGDEATRSALEAAEAELAAAEEKRAPLQAQIEQLMRQFWVTKEQVAANKYDLSASRYRAVEAEETYYEAPGVTMGRLLELERAMADEIKQLESLLADD